MAILPTSSPHVSVPRSGEKASAVTAQHGAVTDAGGAVLLPPAGGAAASSRAARGEGADGPTAPAAPDLLLEAAPPS